LWNKVKVKGDVRQLFLLHFHLFNKSNGSYTLFQGHCGSCWAFASSGKRKLLAFVWLLFETSRQTMLQLVMQFKALFVCHPWANWLSTMQLNSFFIF
jgi:hypothetical protein